MGEINDKDKLIKIFKAQVEKEEQEYFSVNTYTQLLYDSHKTVLRELDIQDKMIDMLCELLEESGPIYKICDEVPTDDCSLECETCIKDIIRKKVMEEK